MLHTLRGQNWRMLGTNHVARNNKHCALKGEAQLRHLTMLPDVEVSGYVSNYQVLASNLAQHSGFPESL
jgi:hypothetical protein